MLPLMTTDILYRSNPDMPDRIYFSHGKDSVPWGTKIRAFAAVAEALEFEVFSPDYRGMDDPVERTEHLLQSVERDDGKLVLAGSSMGAYVSIAASVSLRPEGLFVVAPAVYLPVLACKDVKPVSSLIEVVHGWRDEVIPPESAIRFAQENSATIHMFDGDHRLLKQLPEIKEIFQRFLLRVLNSENGDPN